MKLFKKSTDTTRREDRAYNEAVSMRMRSVLGRETEHDTAEAVEMRLRNMVYGTNKQ